MAEEWRPYILVGRKVLSGNSSGTLTLEVGSTEHFEATSMRVLATSDAFDITGITREEGTPFTNADATNVIDGKILYSATRNSYYEFKFVEPLQLPPNAKLSFELTDTSGSTNEIFIYLIGRIKSV